MTRYRFTIEYRTHDGERRRSRFFGDMNGTRWVRREEVHEGGSWVGRSHELVRAPTVEVLPIGIGSTVAGP